MKVTRINNQAVSNNRITKQPSFEAKIPTDIILDIVSHGIYENTEGRRGLTEAVSSIVGHSKVSALGPRHDDVYYDCLNAFKQSVPNFEQVKQNTRNISYRDKIKFPERIQTWVQEQKRLLDGKEEFEVEPVSTNAHWDKLKQQTYVIKH